jgi:MFS family permease
LSSDHASAPASSSRAFESFANRDFLIYCLAASAAMMADNVEHVISYYVMYQKLHSTAMGAFAVVSHWAPYLLLAGQSGWLADRFDVRRLIQISMLLFVSVSLAWGGLFMTDTVAEWKAMVLLIVHGLAGVLWAPASQVLIHRIVVPRQLPNAVRLVATGRYLAALLGPALGSIVLLPLCGPAWGIFLNALIYLPLVIWLMRAPYGREVATVAAGPAGGGLADFFGTLKVVARNPVLSSMTLMIGASAFFIGNAYQAQMPGFAQDLGHGRAGFAYSVLLGADAAGGLAAGLILEGGGLLPPNPRAAYLLALGWCLALGGFALSSSYAWAIPLLLVAGFLELAFNSMAQSLVQIHAPSDIRGRVIGVFAMSASGMRTFSGLCVGLLGAAIGTHASLAASAGALFALLLGILAYRYFKNGRA